MQPLRDWSRLTDKSARLLKQRTGDDVKTWNQRIKRQRFSSHAKLRAWLTEQGVTGYPQDLLVMERFGYPKFMKDTATELIDAQYADRPQLRPIYDAIIRAANQLGDVAIQARKGYVSLVSPRRTFARVRAITKDRIDLGLRIAGQKPVGRLKPSRLHETMKIQIELSSPKEVDAELRAWLRKAYDENA
jgi:hypothetical protein